jgi:hypothetical protein
MSIDMNEGVRNKCGLFNVCFQQAFNSGRVF